MCIWDKEKVVLEKDLNFDEDGKFQNLNVIKN